MLERPHYIKKITPYVDKPLVKILTGIRRCGKSSILQMLRDKLAGGKASPATVLHINFELLDYLHLDSAAKLTAHLKQTLSPQTRYILFDEIQNVAGWELVVNGLHAADKYDIYITGSNSSLLSGELATRIAGRYLSFHIAPLTFSEHLLFQQKLRATGTATDLPAEFERYLQLGGFPVVPVTGVAAEQGDKIITDIYHSIILRDLVERKKIRNTDQLNRVVRFVLGNLGNTFSAKSIADYLKSQNRKIDIETIYSYLNALEEAFVLSRVHRYDIKGKEVLKTFEKFYVADHSLVNAVLGRSSAHISGFLENIVYHELIQRGYEVHLGKLADAEIDFVATRGTEKKYIQVAYKLDAAKTVEREFAPLAKITDGEKLVLTLEKNFASPDNTISHHNLTNWLTEGKN
ncbi:ATPase [Planctomycetales bacterium]|nr:ATPase [Planctomycetales bacterium]GHS98969.1 ATPase [Planctomycetales bacterium]GHT06981.1 ATPase [Planctomycetales bacterium]